MSCLSLIAAVDERYGLGKANRLLCHLPADLGHFKSLTLGKPVIMGRKTFESIGKPLPKRQNIILSHASFPEIEGVEWAGSLSAALARAHSAPEIMIIGGAKVFQDTLAFASRIYLTVIHHIFDADAFFPEFNKSEWLCKEAIFRPVDDKNLYSMTFYLYERRVLLKNI